jgi:hypothetical protein
MFRSAQAVLLVAALLTGASGCHLGARLDSYTLRTLGTKHHRGFFELYQDDNRLYLLVPKEQQGKEFLLHARVARGIGMMPLLTGVPLMSEPVSLVAHGDRVYLMQRPRRFTATGELLRAVDQAYGPSLVTSARIVSRRRDGALLIDIQGWLLSELGSAGSLVRHASGSDKYSLSEQGSYIESVRAFPDNVNIRVHLTYRPSSLPSTALDTVADARAVPVSVQYQLVRLADQPMAPRRADDRIGYFVSARRDFSSDDPELLARHIWRWRLSGAPQADGTRVPRKPIVYYLDPATPQAVRPVLCEAVAAWQPALLAAGWRDAIRAEPLPAGADPEDLRYPLIHWDVSEDAPNGIGFPIIDPRSGEILSASITLNASNLLRYSRRARRIYYGQSAAAAFDEPRLRASEPDDPDRDGESSLELLELGTLTGMASEFAAQRSLLRGSLIAAGTLLPSDPLPQRLYDQFLKFVAMHEVGHTLGLRHNFKSSAETPVDKLADMAWVREHGLYGSVMDYPAINLPRGAAAADFLYYQDRIGSADRWAIAYGYAADDRRAAELARQAAQPGHGFATDEDAELGIDPTARQWDLGAEPLDWAGQRMATIRQLLTELPARLLRDNAPYYQMSEAVEDLLGQYARAAAVLPSYVGGQYHVRDHVGDPAGRLPLQPVPRDKQRAALQLLLDQVLDEQALVLPADVVARLASHRWRHWGASERFELGSEALTILSSLRRAALQSLLRESRLRRVRDGELRFGAAQVVSVPELLAAVAQALFSDPPAGPPSASRRELQALYIDQLAGFALDTRASAVPDLRALARARLREIMQRLAAAGSGGGAADPYASAHRAEMQDRIQKVLSSQVAERR